MIQLQIVGLTEEWYLMKLLVMDAHLKRCNLKRIADSMTE